MLLEKWLYNFDILPFSNNFNNESLASKHPNLVYEKLVHKGFSLILMRTLQQTLLHRKVLRIDWIKKQAMQFHAYITTIQSPSKMQWLIQWKSFKIIDQEAKLCACYNLFCIYQCTCIIHTKTLRQLPLTNEAYKRHPNRRPITSGQSTWAKISSVVV